MNPSGDGAARNGGFPMGRVSLATIITIVVQTVGVIIILVRMHADIAQHRLEIDNLQRRIELIDNTGSRGLDLIRQRQIDVIGVNSSQEARLRELEQKVSEIQRVQVENKFWVEQLINAVRALTSHGNLPQITPPPR